MISAISAAQPRAQSQDTSSATTGSAAAFSLDDAEAMRETSLGVAQSWAPDAQFSVLRENLAQLRAYEAGETDSLTLGGNSVTVADHVSTESGVTVLGTIAVTINGEDRTAVLTPDMLQDELDMMRNLMSMFQAAADIAAHMAEGIRQTLADMNRADDPGQYDAYAQILAGQEREATDARIQADTVAADWGPKMDLLDQVIDAMWDLIPGAECPDADTTPAVADTPVSAAAETTETSAASQSDSQSEADRKKAARLAAQAMDETWERVKELLRHMEPAEAAPGSEAAARAWDAARAAIKATAIPQAST